MGKQFPRLNMATLRNNTELNEMRLTEPHDSKAPCIICSHPVYGDNHVHGRTDSGSPPFYSHVSCFLENIDAAWMRFPNQRLEEEKFIRVGGYRLERTL